MRIYLMMALLSCCVNACTQTAIKPELYRDSGKVVCAIYNNVHSKATAIPIDHSGLRIEQRGESYIQVEPGKRMVLFSEGAKDLKVISEPGAVSVNVCNYAEDSSAYVSVKKGSAFVSCEGRNWKLQAGQALRFTDSVRLLDDWKVKSDTVWINGGYVTVERPDISAYNALARMSGYSLVHVGKPKYTGYWWQPSGVDLLRTLKMVKKLHLLTYKVRGKTITVYHKN